MGVDLPTEISSEPRLAWSPTSSQGSNKALQEKTPSKKAESFGTLYTDNSTTSLPSSNASNTLPTMSAKEAPAPAATAPMLPPNVPAQKEGFTNDAPETNSGSRPPVRTGNRREEGSWLHSSSFEQKANRGQQWSDERERLRARKTTKGLFAPEEIEHKKKLGTFMGVYVPTTQNVLGVILFLRLPWITGQAGILQAALVVSAACFSTVLTSLSMSAIATNGRVEAGGCYQITKKSLGLECGGVVGILLFLSNTFGVAMYVLGCVEALKDAQPSAEIDAEQDNRIMGTIILATLAAIVYVGIGYISKFAVLFLGGVLFAIASIHAGVFYHTAHPKKESGLLGLNWDTFNDNWGADYDSDTSFAVVLALFFPAVTDPLAGTNLSGDLEDPQKSIPPGTLAAVATTSIIFLLQVFYCGSAVDRGFLVDDKLIVARLAWPLPELIYAGIMLSTLGAGLQSLAGAPRLLAAIAKDRLIPQLAPLAPKDGEEPRLALALTAFLSLCCVMLGSLNAVAPFITMWFLTCYAIINAACFILAYEHAPTFRPKWRYYHWTSSCLGMCICLGMMFFIKPYFALVAVAIAVGIFKYIQHTLLTAEAGHDDLLIDVASDEDENDGAPKKTANFASAIRFNQVRKALMSVEEHDFQFKYWRPFILYLADLDPVDGALAKTQGVPNLISHLMLRGKGLSFVGGVLEGAIEDTFEKQKKSSALLKKYLRYHKIEAFPEVIVANEVVDGKRFLLQGKGFGVLRPNTVMVNFPEVECISVREANNTTALWTDVALCSKTLLVCKNSEGFEFPVTEKLTSNIDVWWVFDILPAKGLLLLIPYMLHEHPCWSHCTLRLFVVTGMAENKDLLTKRLTEMLDGAGFDIDICILQMNETDAPRFTHVKKPVPEDAMKEKKSNSFRGRTSMLFRQVVGGKDDPNQGPNSPRRLSWLGPAVASGSSQETNSIREARSSRSKSGSAADDQTGSLSELTEYLREISTEKTLPTVDTAETPKEDTPSNQRNGSSRGDAYGSLLTSTMSKYSGESALVVMTLPRPDRNQPARDYLMSLEVLTAGLRRCIMIQESGKERVQLHS